MTAPAVTASISFEGVWKKFRTGEVHDSLRDLIPAIGRRLFKKGGPDPTQRREGEFWALRAVSFEVQPGEVLGIIGGNGAGKSTALKILTKILRPTAGQASVRGRIGALIEISAGFHQDLTGRENVFLQGSIMGMPVALIRRKFDEIVEFAGLEKFIDTPVKRYSSGMNARLGFAIAAHLDPEVLIIDEVLAVGDFRFQDKAFGRIRDMSRSGIPVVLVSHQLDRVATLCTKALLLHQGQVMCQGPVGECIDAYLSGGTSLNAPSHPDSPIVLGAIRILQGETLEWGQQADLELEAVIPGRNREAFDSIGLRFRALEGSREVFMTSTRFADIRLPDHGKVRVLVSIRMCLPAGTYSMEPFAWRPGEDTVIATGPISTCHVGRANSTLNRGIVDLEPRLAVSTLSDGGAPE